MGKTFELVAVRGKVQAELDPLFAALDADSPITLDGVGDIANMRLADEPPRVRSELAAVQRRAFEGLPPARFR